MKEPTDRPDTTPFPSLQVADLGCSECTLLKKLRFYHDIELLVGVDVNGAKIKRKMYV